MSSDQLSLFSYEILGLVGRQGASAHDLLQMAQRGRVLAWAGQSQYYTEPKRLAKLGYLSTRKAPGQTRERTVYTLTRQGLAALTEYAQTPVTVTPLKSEALVRLLIGDLVGDEITRASIATLRDDIDDIERRLEDTQRAAKDLPHREKNLTLAYHFLRRYLELHLELVDAVERELDPGPPSTTRASKHTAQRQAPL